MFPTTAEKRLVQYMTTSKQTKVQDNNFTGSSIMVQQKLGEP